MRRTVLYLMFCGAAFGSELLAPANCAKAWPAALDTLTRNDLSIVASDRAGGVLTVAGARYPVTDRERRLFGVGRSQLEETMKLAVVQHPTWEAVAYQIGTGSLVLIERENTCLLRFELALAGTFDSGRGYRDIWLQSNGKIENGLLEKIAKAIQ